MTAIFSATESASDVILFAYTPLIKAQVKFTFKWGFKKKFAFQMGFSETFCISNRFLKAFCHLCTHVCLEQKKLNRIIENKWLNKCKILHIIIQIWNNEIWGIPFNFMKLTLKYPCKATLTVFAKVIITCPPFSYENDLKQNV
uniref:Uncharacterized protein n=1 Tax=Cacopsylla melanoneura TaxID=428564 RepID=A0A8D8RGS6_9HEMI